MRVVLTLILIFGFGLCGEAQVQQAAIEGETSGRVVPGATVDLHNPATNQRRSVVTDASGGFG